MGSVGTRAWIVLMLGNDDSDPLFLQAKEAQASVLEPFLGKSKYANHGQRVVEGQRLMQSASDVMLGWIRSNGIDGVLPRLLHPPTLGRQGISDRRGHGAIVMASYAGSAAGRLPGRTRAPVTRRQSRATWAAATSSTAPWRRLPKRTPTRTSATTRRSNRPSTPGRSQPRPRDGLPMRRRLAAIVALVVGAATLALAVAVAISEFPRGLVLLGCVLIAGVAAWYGMLRRGIARVVGLVVAGLAFAGCTGPGRGRRVAACRSAGRGGAAGVAGGGACRLRRPCGSAERGRTAAPGAVLQPALRWREGGAFCARQGGRAAVASSRSSSRRGDDLEALVRDAVARGADGLAMAGGDGSQAIVAAIAAELGLPYACVPAGTRNHFALDLGVDRDDVVGALDAFVDGGERRVDLGEVNGRVFVNNVSLGLYAEAVQRDGYRDAKIRTLLDTVPDVLGPSGDELDLRWRGPGGPRAPRGRRRARIQQPLPARPRGRLGYASPHRRRPARDHRRRRHLWQRREGRSLQRPWREWSAPTFEVDADRPVAAGIDGEALVLDAPLEFRIRPGVLRVRIARKHPGASPSAMAPEGIRAGVVELARIAFGRPQEARKSRQQRRTRMDN